MSRLAQALRNHRENGRTRREMQRAVRSASAPAMPDELSMVAQRSGGLYGR